jgi:hypothetical protein
MNSGDLVFCKTSGIIGHAIRRAQKRLHNLGMHHQWNHVAVLDRQLPDGNWTVIQAEPRGVTNDKTLETLGEYEVVSLPSEVAKTRFLAFLRMQVGSQYGFLSIASVALDLFLPESICVRRPGTWVCSALVGGALWFCGFPKMSEVTDLYTLTPAEISSWVNANLQP